MDDPLKLHRVPTPVPVRAERIAPAAHIVNLAKRITSGFNADSLETRIHLLAHLIYIIYADLKETIHNE